MNPETTPVPNNTTGPNQEAGFQQPGSGQNPEHLPPVEAGTEKSTAEVSGNHYTGFTMPPSNQGSMSATPVQQPVSSVTEPENNTAQESDMSKQLVMRAKSIVAQTENDPHEKSKRISELKVECNYGRKVASAQTAKDK